MRTCLDGGCHISTGYVDCLFWHRGGGGGSRGDRPPLGKKGGQHPICPPPTFHGSPLSALPSVYQFISCHTLGSTALAFVCVRGHFRVLENEKYSTPCEGKPLPKSVALLPRMCGPPLLNMLLRL